MRTEENKWLLINPTMDSFHLIFENKKQGTKEMDGRLQCVIPAPKCFWEITLGCYVLLRPEVYQSTAFVAQCMRENLLKVCEDMKLSPVEGIDNFCELHYSYIHDLADGKDQNRFETNPFLAIKRCYETLVEFYDQKQMDASEKEKLLEHFSNLYQALEDRDKEFQDSCLRACLPTSK